MSTAFPKTAQFTWEEALREFLLHKQASFAPKTVRYYRIQLTQLVRWANANAIPLDGFGKRQMDRYLVDRSQEGKAPLTLHHDAICTKALLTWCQKNDLIERSLLSEYQVRNAPQPARYVPTDAEIQKLLTSVPDFMTPAKNPVIRYMPLAKRVFHRDRNYAIIIGLLDSACRIGEMLSLKIDDYRAKERQIVIRESKGREPRTLPVSAEWVDALEVWMKQRQKVMTGQDDEGWLFISEFGTRIDESRFGKTLQRIIAWAGISRDVTLHSLRRYSLNRLAKHNLLAAQRIAGHKDTKTTLLYTKDDPDFVREMHYQVGVVRGIVTNRNKPPKKRLV